MKTNTNADTLAAAVDAFAAAFVQSAEYVRWREAKAAVDRDAGLTARLEEFQSLQRMARGSFGQLKGKQAIRLGELQGELEANPLLAEHRDAIQALVMRVTEVNDTLTERLNFDFAGACRPASGCCG